jgi:hypothetical protein
MDGNEWYWATHNHYKSKNKRCGNRVLHLIHPENKDMSVCKLLLIARSNDEEISSLSKCKNCIVISKMNTGDK